MKLSTLPTSLREVITQVKKSGSGSSFFSMGRTPSPNEMRQGTRASPQMGHASASNTPNPIHPGESNSPIRPFGWDNEVTTPPITQFSTEKVVVEGEPGTIIQNRDWPPNPSRESYSPNSGHGEQVSRDGDLHMGPGPTRILRMMPMRIWGIDNASTGQRGTEASYNGNGASHDYLHHAPVARQALGVKGPQKLSDDNAVIPAVYAGNPRA
jgi:hypothetical protein